jgi:hypothetical protein
MRTIFSRFPMLAPGALLLCLACGGSSHEPLPDPGPAYANPATTGWCLKKNLPLSSGRHLVLDLVGPSGGSGLGIAMNLDLGRDTAKASWTPVLPVDSSFVQNAKFDLGPGTPALKASVTDGVLRLGVFSKGPSARPTPYSAPLIRIALDLKEGLKPGETVTITSLLADELVPEGVRPIAVAIGSIQIQ